MSPKNLFDVWNLYELHIEAKYNSIQAKRALNETQSAILRILLRGLIPQQGPISQKMTRAESMAAKESMKTLGVETLSNADVVAERVFNTLSLSKASRNTYGARLKQFVDWCKAQHWWDTSTSRAAAKITSANNDYCPRLRRGYGKANKQLTDRRSTYITYQLQPEDITAELNTELQEFYHFLTDSDRNDRFAQVISHSSAEIYLKHIRLILGWFRLQGTPRKHLSLDLLIPRLTEETLGILTTEQQEQCWAVRKMYIETWLCGYFKFLRDEVGSKSPRTKRFKTHALTALGKFQYRTEVSSTSAYQGIPVLRTISKYSSNIRKEVGEWNRHKRQIVPIEKKWPDIVEGQSALTTIRKQVVEELRISCRIKYSSNYHLRNGSAITTSFRDYIAWSIMTDMPARRQEEFRSWKIALTCPVERPQDVPSSGLYHPLPPNQERERNREKSVVDNYLYKTYVRDGVLDSEGIWMLDIHKYKTHKRYGPQSIAIKNRRFADGSCLYDYIERYLYGWWNSEESTNSSNYRWLEPTFDKQQGQWISSGRAEFEPCDIYYGLEKSREECYAWGYFFVKPRVGTPYNPPEFNRFFSTAAHRIIGKRITPHIIRDMWATWAYQVGLTDAQRESLAYAMGLDIKTLEEIYERCSPEEKRRPIEEAVDKLLFSELELEYHQSPFYLEQLAKELLALPEAERLNHMQFLSH